MQTVIIILLFTLAAGYLINLLYQHFKSTSSCPKGCGSCSAIDLESIQKKIEKQTEKSIN